MGLPIKEQILCHLTCKKPALSFYWVCPKIRISKMRDGWISLHHNGASGSGHRPDGFSTTGDIGTGGRENKMGWIEKVGRGIQLLTVSSPRRGSFAAVDLEG
jgi:hypothetical protein